MLALEVVAGGALLAWAGAAGPAALAALGNLVASLRFGLTLLPGREPLISRYGRHDVAGLPDDGRYTRRLTAVWAAVLAGFALAFLGAALDLWPARALAGLQPVTCATLFLGEHLLRRCCFPGIGRVTPLRTLRAIYLSYR